MGAESKEVGRSGKIAPNRRALKAAAKVKAAKAKAGRFRAALAPQAPSDSAIEQFQSWAMPSLPLAATVHEGLPVAMLSQLEGALPGLARQIIPRSTLAAVKKRSKRLPPENSDRLYQAGKVLGFAMQIFGTADLAREFLSRRHPMLDDRRPMDVAVESGAGADLVINILGRGAYGGGA